MTDTLLEHPVSDILENQDRDRTEQEALLAAERAAEADEITRAQAGDETGFADLYTRHYPAILRRARGLTGNDADAEDVAQTTFMRALTNIEKFENKNQQGMGAWLMTITRNYVFDLSRRASGKSVFSLDDAIEAYGGDHSKWVADRTAEDPLQAIEDRDVLKSIIAQLSETNQERARILGYRILLDITEAQAVQELGIKHGTYSSGQGRLREALADLKSQLA